MKYLWQKITIVTFLIASAQLSAVTTMNQLRILNPTEEKLIGAWKCHGSTELDMFGSKVILEYKGTETFANVIWKNEGRVDYFYFGEENPFKSVDIVSRDEWQVYEGKLLGKRLDYSKAILTEDGKDYQAYSYTDYTSEANREWNERYFQYKLEKLTDKEFSRKRLVDDSSFLTVCNRN